MGIAGEETVKFIIAAEAKWANSACSPQPDLKEVIADDFQGTSPSGHRYDKAKAIATDTKALERDCQLGEVKVRFSATPSRSRMEQKAQSPRLKMARRQSIV